MKIINRNFTGLILLFSAFIFLFLICVQTAKADAIETYCSSQGLEINSCIKQVAVERKDIALCDRIQDEGLKGSCLGAFATINNNFELCKKIPKDTRGFENRYKCFLKFVKSKENVTICEELIKNERMKDDCYSTILDEDKSDATLCGKFSSESKRASCYFKAAKAQKNVAVCENILAEKQAKRTSKCKYCEDKGFDFDKTYNECREYFFMKGIVNICSDYAKAIEVELRWHGKQVLVFPGEHEVKDKFWVTFKWAEFKNKKIDGRTANFDISDGVKNDAAAGLCIGQSVIFDGLDTGIQVLNIKVEEEGEDNEQTPYASICVFRPSTKQAEETEKKGSDEGYEKEQEEKRKQLEQELLEKQKKLEEETNQTEEDKSADTEENEENKTSDKTKEESKSKVVKVKEGGIFYRIIMLFKGLF